MGDTVKRPPAIQRRANRNACASALRTVAVAIVAMLAVSEFGSPARAGTLYWDTDGSTGDNNASVGANLGGSGLWSSDNANWWTPAERC
jgi:hypothetical protein